MIWPRGGHDVLVRLKAASLNPADIYFRSYGPYIKNAAPILGHDGAGVVEEVGGDEQEQQSAQAVAERDKELSQKVTVKQPHSSAA